MTNKQNYRELDTILCDLIKDDPKTSDEYILIEDLKKLELSSDEFSKVKELLDENGIALKSKKELPKSRHRKLVKNYNYGEKTIEGTRRYEKDKLAKIEYSDDDDIISTDFSELENFLEDEFISKFVKVKKRKDYFTRKLTTYLSIPLNKIVSLGLSEIELTYVMDYLAKNNIEVSGRNTSLEKYFSNYDSITTYGAAKFPKSLSKEETDNLFKEYQEKKDTDIRNKIIIGNLRLVPKVCLKYKFTGVDFNEIMSIGFEGLIRSVDNFDPSYGNSFSTYACSSIENRIITDLPKIEGFKYSKEYFDYIHARNLVLSYYKNSDEEIPENIYQDIILLLEETGKYSNSQLEELACRISTINYTDYDDLEESLVDDSSLERSITLSLLKDALKKSIETLPEREQVVLTAYYGLDDKICHTFKEISLIVGVSSSMCSQIERKSKVHLSNRGRIRDPKDYYDHLQNLPSEPLEGTNKVLIK